MADIVALIDQLIEEHKAFKEKLGTVESGMNDATIMKDIANTRDSFKPGAPGLKVNLDNISTLLESIGTWLEKHFLREETVLKPAVDVYGDKDTILSLNQLLFEHADLRFRMDHSRKRVADLIKVDQTDSQWQTNADDAKFYLHHTNVLLETHTKAENKLFKAVRKVVKKKQS